MMPRYNLTRAAPTVAVRRPVVSPTQSPMSVHVPDPWNQQLSPGSQYTHISYWSQRIEAIIMETMNWHMPQFNHCRKAFQADPSATRAALNSWLRSFSSPSAFRQAMPPGVQQAYPAYVPTDVWFASTTDKYLAVQGADKFTKGPCKSISSGGILGAVVAVQDNTCNVAPVPKSLTKYHVKTSDVSGLSTPWNKHVGILIGVLGKGVGTFSATELQANVQRLVGANSELPLEWAEAPEYVGGGLVCLIKHDLLKPGLVLTLPEGWGASAWPDSNEETEPIRIPGGTTNVVQPPGRKIVELPDRGAAQDDDDAEDLSPWLIFGGVALAIGGAWWMMTQK